MGAAVVPAMGTRPATRQHDRGRLRRRGTSGDRVRWRARSAGVIPGPRKGFREWRRGRRTPHTKAAGARHMSDARNEAKYVAGHVLAALERRGDLWPGSTTELMP